MAVRQPHLGGHVWAARWTLGRRSRTIRPRGTGDWLLLLTIAGVGRFRTGSQAITLQPGSLAVVRPDTPEDYGTDPDADSWENVWVHFHPRPHWLPWLALPTVIPEVSLLPLPADLYADVRVCLERAVGFAQHDRALDRTLGYLAVEEALARIDARLSGAGTSEDRRLKQAQAFLEANLGQAVSGARVASAVGCSPRHLARLFAARLGVGVRTYLEQRRMAVAADLLLRTDLPIQDIASRCGFPNPFHFSTRFRLTHGHSPRAWRTGRG
jgi:AraC family transcriptional regulator of arabinose operon